MTLICTRRGWLRCVGGSAALSSGIARAAPSRADKPAFTLSVVPQFPAAELHRDWTPLLERIARETGLSIGLRLAPTIPRFEVEMMQGVPDFAFMNPYHAVMASRGPRYLPLVRDSKALAGILVVARTSPVQAVRELDGLEIAFPAPNAFGASLWMRALLAERERIRITPVYVQTHSNVYRHVIRGKAAAGGGVNSTLQQESDEVRGNLRVLYETPGVASHPLCAHPRVPAAVRQAVADALLRLAADPAGQPLLKEVALPRPVLADYARDYGPIEQYRLDKYAVIEPNG